MMIDFHNHILPDVDDGASSIEVSIQMLKEAERQGITDVVNTTHFKHPKMVNKDVTYENIYKKASNLKNILAENNISINIHLGAETLFHDDILELKNNDLVTFSNGKFILIEFLTNYLPENHKEILYDLKMAGVTPIIAHPERYISIQQDIQQVARWLEAGCLIQVDAGSPIGLLGIEAKKASEIIIKNRWCQILGSDAHNDRNRNFCLFQSLEYVYSLIGEEAKMLVNENPKSILLGQEIEVDVNYDNLYKGTIFDNIKNKIQKLKRL